MHLYKEVSLSKLIETETPLLIFAQYNKITTTLEEREKYYNLVKSRPQDLDDLFDDLKVLGKREIGSILKWRGKVLHQLNLRAQKEQRAALKAE
jgi:hypothetical protein